MATTYLTREDYLARVTRPDQGGYWSGYKGRWRYHEQAIGILRRHCGITAPGEVLEIGTMGVQLVPGSDTMDLVPGSDTMDTKNSFRFAGKETTTTFLHDARKTPWPIPDKKYRCVVALRVFHHLHPRQRECFREARRVAHSVLVVAPHRVADDKTRGITPGEWYDYNDGKPPMLTMRTSTGDNHLLFWDDVALTP